MRHAGGALPEKSEMELELQRLRDQVSLLQRQVWEREQMIKKLLRDASPAEILDLLFPAD
jgi:hypothetical protein